MTPTALSYFVQTNPFVKTLLTLRERRIKNYSYIGTTVVGSSPQIQGGKKSADLKPGFGLVIGPLSNLPGRFALGNFPAQFRSARQQSHVTVAAAKVSDVDVVVLEQFEKKIAQWCWAIEDAVLLMTVPAAGDNGRQVIVGVVGGVAEVAADHNRGVVQQTAVSFRNLIQFKEELVEMPNDVGFDAILRLESKS